MTQLAAAVDADDKMWTLDTLPPSPYVEVDDELVEIRSTYPAHIYQPTQELLPPKIRVIRGSSGTTAASHAEGATLTPVYIPGSTGSETVFRSERVTFDMEGLGSTDNPPVPGIRLGDYVVPAGSFVLATVHIPTEFDTTPPGGNLTLHPLIRNTDGQTATALVDAFAGPGSPGGSTSEGITSSVDPENSVITTEDTHLGVGMRVEAPQLGSATEAIDISETELEVGGFEGLIEPPFLVLVDSEIMNVTVTDPSPPGDLAWLWTVQRGQEGTSAETHEDGAAFFLGSVAELSVGEAYIVFWITPLSGDLP